MFLTIDYRGDLAWIYDGSVPDPTGGTLGSGLLDDHSYDGESWVVSLNGLAVRAGHEVRVFTLAVMPLRSDAPIFLEAGAAPTYDSSGQACSVPSVRAQPAYTLEVNLR